MENKFGDRLTKMRKAKGLTQEEVGEKIGISAQAVSKWENDTTMPDPIILKRLSDIYGVTLNQIYGMEDQPTVSIKENKDINKLLIRIIVDTKSGDKVRVNLPLALIKVCLNSGVNLPNLNGNDILKNIDFNQILTLVEQGIVGNLVDVDTANGDTIHIIVE